VYPITNKSNRSVFGHNDTAAADVTYVNWLNLLHLGLIGVESYSPGTGQWTQAHGRANFVILNVSVNLNYFVLEVTTDSSRSSSRPDRDWSPSKRSLTSPASRTCC
jgi:hypothetical protein